MREGIATILTCLPLLWAPPPWAAVRAREPAPASRPATSSMTMMQALERNTVKFGRQIL